MPMWPCQVRSMCSERISSEFIEPQRSSTFIISVNPYGGRLTARKNLISETARASHQHLNKSKPHEWSDKAGRVTVKVWSGNTPQQEDKGLRTISGWPVIVGDHLSGHYARIDLDSSGRGTVQQDPYGLHPLYMGNACGVSLIANRPQLIAFEIERLTGKRAERDHCFAAWLALSGYPIGNRTGYEDVRCIPFGATVRIDTAHRIRFSSRTPPWRLSTKDLDVSCIDRIEAELIANLRASIRAMSAPPRLLLTGGRDSRLVLALAVRAGLLRDVEIVTYGKADLPDAIVAKDIATRLGLHHTLLNWDDGVTTQHQLCAHVHRVAGAVSPIDSNISLSKEGRIGMSGLLGETLRTNWSDKPDYQDLESVVTGYLSGVLGRSGLLHRDPYTTALSEGLKCLLEPVEQLARPADLLDIYYLQHRVRRWLGARPERLADEFLPLYYPPATELAFQMGWSERVVGRIHDTIIERAGRLLSEPPYYKPGGFYKPVTTSSPLRKGRLKRTSKFLSDTAHGYLRLFDKTNFDKLIMEHVNNAFKNDNPTAITGSDTVHPHLTKRQTAYLELIAARDNNPIFNMLDRERLIDAINCLPSINPYIASQIHAAMTGVIWLGQLEREN